MQEWNKVPQETYNAKPRRVAWVDASRHVDETDDERVPGNLKHGVFPSIVITYAVIQMVGKIADENDKVDIITNSVIETMEFKNLTDQVAQVAQGLHS